MPFSFQIEQMSGLLLTVLALLTATLTALWLSLIVWTFRDMRSRTRDVLAQVLAALVVAILNIPGLLVYLVLRPPERLSEQYERALEEEALLREIEDKLVCPGCGAAAKEEWRVCPYCHTRLKKECQNCHELLDLSWTLCPYCEAPQREGAAARRSSPT